MNKSLRIGFVIIIVSFMVITVHCQEWKLLIDSAKVYNYNHQDSPTALKYANRALESARREFGEDDTSVTYLLNWIGSLYLWDSNLPNHSAIAESVLTLALINSEKWLTRRPRDVVKVLNNLALVYEGKNHDKAIQSYLRAISIPIDPPIIMPYLNLARIFYNKGEYTIAEFYSRKGLELCEKMEPMDSIQLMCALISLGEISIGQGRYREAMMLSERALPITEHVPDRYYEGCTMMNLVSAYMSQGMVDRSLQTAKKCLELWQEYPIKDRSEEFSIMGKLAEIFQKAGDYKLAENLYRKTIEGFNSIGRRDVFSAWCLASLAYIYMKNGNNRGADSAFQEAMVHWNQDASGRPSEFTLVPEIVSDYYRGRGEHERALMYALSAYNKWKSVFINTIQSYSERDAMTLAALRNSTLTSLFSCLRDAPKHLDMEQYADIILSVKGEVSDIIFNRQLVIGQQQDSVITEYVRELNLIRDLIAKLHISSDDKGRYEIDSLTALSEKIEFKLAHQSSYIAEKLSLGSVTSQKISEQLPPNSVLVEFMKYQYHSLNPDTLNDRYIVLVIDKSGILYADDFASGFLIDEEVMKYRKHLLSLAQKNGLITPYDQKRYTSIARKLYTSIWKPIESKIKKGAMLIICPDADMNLISFAGLIDEKGSYLIEKHPIHYLSAGRDLMRMNLRRTTGSGLIAFGDPDYNATVEERIKDNNAKTFTYNQTGNNNQLRNIRSNCSTLRELFVMSLPETRYEIVDVSRLWINNFKNEPVSVYFGSDASEEKFKNEIPGNRIVHLATHGYYINKDCVIGKNRKTPDAATYINENPLLMSGLLLAGANLHGKDADIHGAEDGILTALEVTAMDLRGVDLVILSACETGLGEIKKSEGVYGLRRGFQLAGARTVVSSLWQIPDAETKSFMKDLYAQNSKTYPELLQEAALRRIKELRLRGKPTHPYTWGGFIATGDWRIK